MHALFLADHVLLECVCGQTRPAPARRQRCVAGDQAQAPVSGALGTDASHHGQAVGLDPAQQRVGKPLDLGRDLGRVHAGESALLRRSLCCWGLPGKVLPEDPRRCRGAVVHHDPADLHRDREPLPVVDVHQATDRSAMARTQKVLPLRGDGLQPGAVRPLVHGGGSLHEHVERGVAVSVLACVVRQGDRWVATDSLELLRQTQGARHRDGAGVAVAKSQRRHRHDDHAAGRCDRGDANGRVPSDDLVNVVVPLHAHRKKLAGISVRVVC